MPSILFSPAFIISPCASLTPSPLPHSAYTTLPKHDIPLCRLITSLHPPLPHQPAPSLAQLSHIIPAALDIGLSTFDVPSSYLPPPSTYLPRPLLHRAQFIAPLFLAPSDIPSKVTSRLVHRHVDALLNRLRVDRIHLLTVHWPDWNDRRYLDILAFLDRMRDTGKIGAVGGIRWPKHILLHAVNDGLTIVANRVTIGLPNKKKEEHLVAWARQNGVAVLADGPGGNVWAENFLGMPEPRWDEQWKREMGAWGGWGLFQELLYALKSIADKYGVSVENVVVRWMLERDLNAVVIEKRIKGEGSADNLLEGVRAFEFELDDEDKNALENVLGRGNDISWAEDDFE